MRLTATTICLTALGVLALTSEALAWGPATHLTLGTETLANLSLLPGAVAALLARHRIAYLYGNIAADIVFAKRLSRVKQFCHHWSTAFRLIDSAETDRARAFAYGYLSHLAADTIAHGKFVPRQIAVSQCSVNFGHLYWELRADALQNNASWRSLERVLQCDHTTHHRAMARHITDTFLPYKLNHVLFNRVNHLTIRRPLRWTVGAWSRRSRNELSPGLVEGYESECLDRIFSILSEGALSALLHEDPNGTSALMQLRVRRREVRRLMRRGDPIEHRLLEVSRGLAPRPLSTRHAPSLGPPPDESKSATACA